MSCKVPTAETERETKSEASCRQGENDATQMPTERSGRQRVPGKIHAAMACRSHPKPIAAMNLKTMEDHGGSRKQFVSPGSPMALARRRTIRTRPKVPIKQHNSGDTRDIMHPSHASKE